MVQRISNEAVQKATGGSWDQWHRLLKDAGADEWSHKETVAYLREEHGMSHWWGQTVTVDYEQHTGKRQVGQTQTVDYQIGVRRTVNLTSEDAWNLLFSREGSQIWLGDIALVEFEKGTRFKTADGIEGEVRVNRPYHHIRLTWKPDEWENSSTLQIRVIPTTTGRTTISIHQEKLENEVIRERMRAHWKKVLGRLEELIDNE